MDIITGINEVFNIFLFAYMILGVVVGIVCGAMPGLTAPMVLGLSIPFTFSMEPLQAILFLLAIKFGANYGGAITAILVNTPGTPSGAATAIDGYQLTLKGSSRKALQTAAISALVGGFISFLFLLIFSPLIAQFALKFGPPEYFAMGILGLSVVGGVAGKSIAKGFSAALVGIFFSLIGTDPIRGTERFTFGNDYLVTGLELIAVLIGLFAVSQILTQLLNKEEGQDKNIDSKSSGGRLTWKDIRGFFKTLIKGSFIGSFIGALPGTGSVLSSFLSYGEAQRSSKNTENFGKGELEGVAAAETGTTGTESASLIPLLTFGIPGDTGAAIILGAFILHGVDTGPNLFEDSGSLISGLFVGIVILEVLVFIFGWYGSFFISKITKIPNHYLYANIVLLVVAGTFSLEGNMFNVWVALFFGLLGFLMLRFDYPIPPLLLGVILGPIIEKNFLLSLSTSGGSPLIFVTRPITLVILILAVILLFLTTRMHNKTQKTAESLQK